MHAYITCVILLALVGLATWIGFFGVSLDSATLPLGLALFVVCATERFFPVSFGVGKARYEFGGAPILFAAVLLGPACALLVAVPSAIYRDPLRSAFQGSVHVVQVLAASLAFLFFSPAPLLTLLAANSVPNHGFWTSITLGALASGLVFFGLDALIGPTLMRLKYRLSWREVANDLVIPALPADGVIIASVFIATQVSVIRGPLAAVILLLGISLSLSMVDRTRRHRKKMLRLQQENAALGEALRSSNLAFASRLIDRLGSRDGRAASHAAASALYARDVAEEMGLGGEKSQQVRLAALLQDVGLLFVPDEVLLTPPEKLNSLGRMQLEEHPVATHDLLSSINGMEEISRWVRWHHERPDGGGYPDRLRAPWIPTEAKILAATSFYASLVLDGPAAPGLSPDKARRALVAEMGAGVDEGVTRAFLRVLDSERETYALATDERFSFPTNDRAVSASPTL